MNLDPNSWLAQDMARNGDHGQVDPAYEAWCDEQYDSEPYCDYCERDGHTFRTCPERDDDFGDES